MNPLSKAILPPLILSLLLLVGGASSGNDQVPTAKGGGIRLVSQKEIADGLGKKNGPLLLDVRTRREFAGGHLPGALNVPLGEIRRHLDGLQQKLGPQGEIIVYCEAGGRAEAAGRTLLEAGFARVGHMLGDMSAWRAAKLPTHKGTSP